MEETHQQTEKRMTFRLDPETWTRFRVILIREQKSMQEVFEDYVHRYIEAKEPK